jgi:hypothetical protein
MGRLPRIKDLCNLVAALEKWFPGYCDRRVLKIFLFSSPTIDPGKQAAGITAGHDVFESSKTKEHKMAYTLDTKVGDLLNDPEAVKIAEKYVPGISKNPMIGMAKGMSLRSILGMPQAKQAGVTEEQINRVLTEINNLKK